MITLHTLASGSEGNSLLIEADGVCLLIDAGISTRRIQKSLQQLGLDIDRLQGIFITHEHADHMNGLQTLVKHHNVPIYTAPATARQLSYRVAGIEPLLHPTEPGSVLDFGSCRVTCFATSHDAAQSMDYRVDAGLHSAAVLTDTGFVTVEAERALLGTELLVLESNHDVNWLRAGSYPYHLQERILGRYGHLSNDTAAEFARQMALCGTKQIVLAHLSRENNTPERALEVVGRAVADLPVHVTVAPRRELSRAYRTEGALCRR